MAPFFFQHAFCDIFVIPEIEIVMPRPLRAVAEDDRRDTVVALAHDKVCKAGNLIHYCFFGYLEDMPEQIGIPAEVPNRTKPAPTDRVAGLSAPEGSAAGVSDDDPDIPGNTLSYLFP